ncbi:MAG: hypothetical protein IPH55_13810 [Betaproteobacteria bacterium]|nr:hypothetical protein [Betaproteobacteria bacterium]
MLEAEEDQRGQCRVEERDAGAQQPAARGQLREQQDRQRAPDGPPAIMTMATKITSPASSAETRMGSGGSRRSRWIHQNVTSPKEK